LLFAAAAAAACLTSAEAALATTYQWIGGDSADWNTNDHWSPMGIPNAGDTARVISTLGATQTITYDYTGTAVTLGTVNVDLTGSTVNSEIISMSADMLLAVNENVGDSGSGSNGSGTFAQSGGFNQVGGSLGGGLSLGVNATDMGLYKLSSTGTLGVVGNTNSETIGENGTGSFMQSGGLNSDQSFSNAFVLGENTNSTGTYNLSAGSVGVSGDESVGYSGNGTFNQSGGTNIISGGGGANQLDLGENTGGTGTYILSGGGTLSIAGPTQIFENVGYEGSGSFIQTGGSNTIGTGDSGSLQIGADSGAVGTYSLSGGLLTVNGGVGVGGFDGGLGIGAGGTGTLTVSGSGRMVGNSSLYIFPNGTVSASSLVVGGGTAFAGNIVIGPGADIGTVNQSGGSNTLSDDLELGALDGTTGSYTLSAGSLAVTADETLGFEGTGVFNQTGGTNTVGGTLYLAGENTATGTYALSGGTLTVDGSADVGYSNVGSGGTGVLTVSSTGQMVVSNTLTIYNFSSVTASNEYVGGASAANASIVVGPGGDNGVINQTAGTNTLSNDLELGVGVGTTGTYTLSGGVLTVNGNERVGYDGLGIFNESVGTNDANGNFNLGFAAGATGSYTLSGGALNVAGNANIGGQNAGAGGVGTLAVSNNGAMTVTGALTIYNNGAVSTEYEYVGGGLADSGGIIAVGPYTGGSNGSVFQNGGTSTVSEELEIALGGDTTGTYTLSNTASLTVDQTESIGEFGTAVFNQTGGTNTVEDNGDFTFALSVGYGIGSTGTYALSNTGTLSVNGEEFVGNVGVGIFNQSGGVNRAVADLAIGSDSISTGSYTLSGGSLISPAIYVGGDAGGAGGTGVLTVSNTGVLSDSGTLTVYPNGLVNVNGGSTSVGGLSISGGGVVNINASLVINFGSPANDPISTIVGYLSNGYHGATPWTGASATEGVITSASAAAGGKNVTLGYLDGNIDTTDRAEVAPNQILIKYTLTGDTNLDGIVNFTDFATVLKNFAQPGTDWAEGNFTYNANSPSIQGTNFTDFADVLANFLQPFPAGGASPGAAGLSASLQIEPTVTALPEPTSLSLLAAGAVTLLARRRRRRPGRHGPAL